MTDGSSPPPHSYEGHLYSRLVARDSHPLMCAGPLYTHPCTISCASFWTSSLSLGEPQIVLWFWVAFLPHVCGVDRGSRMSFQCLLAGRAGLVLYGLATPLLPNDSLEFQQEMWCHAREEVHSYSCMSPS